MKNRLALAVVVVSVLLGAVAAPAVATTNGRAAPTVAYHEPFNGSPGAPVPWEPANWDVTVHSRDTGTWDRLETMNAEHGPDCAGPPSVHSTSSYEDAVFLCRDHVMTALNSTGYGLIYLTPDHLVNFSGGEAVIKVDVSTLRASQRDWWDIWVTPFGDNLQLAGEDWYPDLQGPPRNAVHVKINDFNNGRSGFTGQVFRNFNASALPGNGSIDYESFLTPDAARRDTFELRISRTRIKFCMPAYGRCWIDAAIADLGWDLGVVQFGHHSYNPSKDPKIPGAHAGTWHWDNVSISPATPFTMLPANTRAVGSGMGTTVSLPAPAPAGAFLRFAGIGSNIEVNYGSGWTAAPRQAQRNNIADHFSSYWAPIPAGTTQIGFRAQAQSLSGRWMARDISVWADNGVSVAPPGAPPEPSPAGVSTEVTPVPPSRLLDTRPDASTGDSQQAGTGHQSAGTQVELQVAGRAGVPADAAAVVLNVTATNPDAAGYLTVYPCGAAFPLASSLNYSPGRDVANTVIAELGAGGKVCVYAGAAGTDIVADVTGYYPSTSTYAGAGPFRLLDTRSGATTGDAQQAGTGFQGPGSQVELQVAGRAGVPADAAAVVLNVTATNPDAAGYLTVYPCGAAFPLASSLNYSPGRDVANTVIAELGAGGKVCVYAGAAGTDIVADVTGYHPAGTTYTGTGPFRLLDTRPGAATGDGQQAGTGHQNAGNQIELQASGRAGVPIDAAAVVLNVTATNPDAAGYLTVYPCGTAFPLASSLNYSPGRDVANTVIVQPGSGGRVCVYAGVAGTDVVADVVGYFPANAGSRSGVEQGFTSAAAGARRLVCELG